MKTRRNLRFAPMIPFVALAFLAPASAAPPAKPIVAKAKATVKATTPTVDFTRYGNPAGTRQAKVVAGDVGVLPNGRLLNPTGERLYTAGSDLFDLSLSPDGKTLIGNYDGGMTIWQRNTPGGIPRAITQKNMGFAGAFTHGGAQYIVSNGDAGHGISIYDATSWSLPSAPGTTDRKVMNVDQEPLFTIAADKETYIQDIVLAPDGHTVYALDVARQRVIVFDLTEKKVIADVAAGRQPYALALNADGSRLFVANIGIFDYSLVPPPAEGSGFSKRGLRVPPFGFPSKEAETGVQTEGRFVPGLGSPRVPDAQSLWSYDVRKPASPTVTGKAKTGILIHAPADNGKSVGGSAPNALYIHGNNIWVSNANNDTVQAFDVRTLKLNKTIKLTPTKELSRLRGIIPTGMVMNRKGTRLYVAEAGINAVAVIDPIKGTVLGHIPTGWYPTQLALGPFDEKLFIATQKGIGRGPRGYKSLRPKTDERFGLGDMPGMVDVISTPKDADLASLTQKVLDYNGLLPVAAKRPEIPKDVQYVVFITKENHTFDGIFGTLEGADGDPDYAEFGEKGWIREKGKTERLPIMPNHLKLARQFAVSDNFYMEPEASGDGHRWLVGVYPSIWTTRVYYSGWGFSLSESARARMTSFGSNGSQIPEDYLENGSLWEHLGRGNISFRNYGEGYELPHNDEGMPDSKTGANMLVNFPMPKILFDNTCFEFPAYNNSIPDIARADWFMDDVTKYRKTHKGALPRFLNIAICNDHGAGANASRGYPYTSSYMADNDLALGRIMEFLSKQPEWKKMVVFVTQDDSGGDGDHVDRQRSFVLGLGPWIKPGYVSHDHTSIMSIHKTIYRIFGLGPNNLFDAVTTDLSDMFTDKPNFAPYKHVASDPRVFKPEDTMDPDDPEFKKRRGERPAMRMDDPKWIEKMREESAKPQRQQQDED